MIGTIESADQGAGDVGRYLDGLTGRVTVIAVISPRLAGMLERRGFVNDGQDNWTREPAETS